MSQGAGYRHSTIEYFAIPVEDALALEEGLLALRTRGACDPEPSPERDGERRRPALIDWSGLGRLERRAFASTVEAASLPKGQPAWERWECDVSENGLMYEVIEAYRLSGSDDVALCWHHGDGGNAAASHSHGPARISREALGALRAGLDSLWREALDRRRRGEPVVIGDDLSPDERSTAGAGGNHSGPRASPGALRTQACGNPGQGRDDAVSPPSSPARKRDTGDFGTWAGPVTRKEQPCKASHSSWKG